MRGRTPPFRDRTAGRSRTGNSGAGLCERAILAVSAVSASSSIFSAVLSAASSGAAEKRKRRRQRKYAIRRRKARKKKTLQTLRKNGLHARRAA